MQTEKLSISLPTDMARMVRRQVEQGGYASNSEVIRDALRVWLQHQEEIERRLGSLRAKLSEAAADPVRYSEEDIREHFDRLVADAETKHRP